MKGCNCKFVIVQTSDIRNPSANDTCWGIGCKECGKVIYQNFTKADLKKYL